MLAGMSTVLQQRPARTPPSVVVRGCALAVLVACGAGVLVLRQLVVGTRAGQHLDRAVLQRVLELVGTRTGATRTVLSSTTELSVGAVLVVLVGIALARRRPQAALGAAVVVLGSSATTALLKLVLGGSLPSGHTTAVAGLTCAAVLVAPRWARPVLALVGAAATVVEGTATMVAGWHRPVDLLAACLVVVGWSALVVAAAPRGASTGLDSHGLDSHGGDRRER